MWLLLALSAFADESVGERIAAAARHHVERQQRLARDDCSGLVESILKHAGVLFAGNTASFWATAEAEGRTHTGPPAPGDLVFWDATYDRDRNGRLDDPLTHIGVVMGVEPDGTVRIAHRGTRTGVSEVRMTLRHPSTPRDADGNLLNSWLRAPDARPAGPRLAGELFRGFASPVRPAPAPVALPAAPEPVLARVVDGRKLRHADLSGLDCDALWVLRNAVFARHGYRFSTERARRTFAAMDWYEPDPVVGPLTVSAFLTGRDQANIARILDAEGGRCVAVDRVHVDDPDAS